MTVMGEEPWELNFFIMVARNYEGNWLRLVGNGVILLPSSAVMLIGWVNSKIGISFCLTRSG